MKRISPEREIIYISNVIEKNIDANKILNDRGLLSQNVLSQLRNLVEDIAILINNKENNLTNDTHYENIDVSMKYIKGKAKYKYIYKFHEYLQSTASHYTPNDADAERLILYYFRYMCMLKDTLKEEFNIDILKNLDEFPIYEDYLTKEHYDLIAEKIEEVELNTNEFLKEGRFYVYKVRPIYSKGKIYYEITLTKATNYNNKFEHITMYSKLYIPDNYSVKVSYVEKTVEIMSNTRKIKVIDRFFTSIRPCELNNIAKILNIRISVDDKHREYGNLMRILMEEESTILEEILKDKDEFDEKISIIREKTKNNDLSNLLIELRKLVLSNKNGSNIIRYFLTKTENSTIKDQLSDRPNNLLSNLYLLNKSIPFDAMPYAMSLSNHNICWRHLIKAIDISGREHELLARHIQYNCENNSILYTSSKEVEFYGNIEELVEKYNDILIRRGIDRNLKNRIVHENSNLYIKSYEEDSINIIEKLENYKTIEETNFQDEINKKILEYTVLDISQDKIDILCNMLENKRIALIHGPAGTGKTKMLEIITDIFKEYNKIFLANTNNAKGNLERRIKPIDQHNSTFQNVHNYIRNNTQEYDILLVDECSTISNKDMRQILNKNYKLIILSGDIHQIESIRYGNWFTLTYNYFKNDFVYELINNNRTTDEDLIELWKLIRDNDDAAISKLNSKEYSHEIDETIFERESDDEIVLCLNYDGLYGINNINKIMQERNEGSEYNIGVDTYKINDPIVFNDCPRFSPMIYNNMKGIIKDIEIDDLTEKIWFTIEVQEQIYNPLRLLDFEILEYLPNKKTMIKFFVKKFKDSNEDDDGYEHIVPFNLAYAVSIHKAQGLEYGNVKVVITSNVEENISKNIFYTSITRAKNNLKIYWSAESQKKLFENFKKRSNSKDISILKSKINKINQS